MTPATLYHIASAILILFAAGHTLGFLRFTPATAEGRSVKDTMDSVRFPLGSRSYSWGGFYRGFGIYITAYLLFSAALASHFASLAQTDPQAIGLMGWALCLLQVVGLVLSWLYFAPITAIFSALAAGCLGWAAWLVR